MSAAFAELPLAVFTTLAPIGAGALIVLAAVLLATSLEEAQLKRLDRLTAVPIVLVCVGFLASLAHLASPGNVLSAFASVGSSPLSNEVVAGIVFLVVALVYLALALAGKLGGARRAWAAVVGIVGLVFVVFTGMAYMIPTIPSWNTPFGIVQVLGYALAGGAALLVLMGAPRGSGELVRVVRVIELSVAVTYSCLRHG